MRLEPHVHRILFEVDILDDVGLFVSISPDDRLELELVKNPANFVPDLMAAHYLLDAL